MRRGLVTTKGSWSEKPQRKLRDALQSGLPFSQQGIESTPPPPVVTPAFTPTAQQIDPPVTVPANPDNTCRSNYTFAFGYCVRNINYYGCIPGTEFYDGARCSREWPICALGVFNDLNTGKCLGLTKAEFDAAAAQKKIEDDKKNDALKKAESAPGLTTTETGTTVTIPTPQIDTQTGQITIVDKVLEKANTIENVEKVLNNANQTLLEAVPDIVETLQPAQEQQLQQLEQYPALLDFIQKILGTSSETAETVIAETDTSTTQLDTTPVKILETTMEETQAAESGTSTTTDSNYYGKALKLSDDEINKLTMWGTYKDAIIPALMDAYVAARTSYATNNGGLHLSVWNWLSPQMNAEEKTRFRSSLA